jgi:2-polyprenyl-3-methyl-5-hydroxy-6-metoxy-1,4-benzoquinol methylase
MGSLNLVQAYFEREAARFAAIYESDKPLHQRLGDAIFRRVILERFSLVINAAAQRGNTVLDVGCGPGRYPIELARRGAGRCVGVDVAADMIDIAKKEGEVAGVGQKCDWIVSEYLDWNSHEKFDAVIAMGYYDYLEQPEPHLRKMIEQSKARVFCSFPKRWEVRVPLRAARFKFAHGFVRFYSRQEILDLFSKVGDLQYLSLVDLGRDYIAIYNTSANNAPNGA